jgi:glycosyltransferase involved in cell wall biosynthesis
MRTKLLMIIFSLDKGGAEKIFSFLANNLDLNKFDIYFLTINKTKKDAFVLRPEVKHIQLDHSRMLFGIYSIYKSIKEVNPAVIMSTLSPVNIIVGFIRKLGFFKNSKFILRESSIPSVNNVLSGKHSALLDYLTREIYHVFNALVCQSQDMKLDLIENYGIDANKIYLINNPNLKSPALSNDNIDIDIPKDKKILICVGNLRREKGQDRLLNVLQDLKGKIDFQFWIIGDGVKRETLHGLVSEYGLENDVFFLGHKKNVTAYLKHADLFLQGSYYEGFPNALLEANELGVPVVAFNVKGGTKEIVQNGLNGFLVDDNDLEAFRNAILKALEFPFNKQEIIGYVNEKFDESIILNKYEKLILHV